MKSPEEIKKFYIKIGKKIIKILNETKKSKNHFFLWSYWSSSSNVQKQKI